MSFRNEPCWCGSGKKQKKCHPNGNNNQAKFYLEEYGILVKTPHQIEKIRIASKVAASILDKLCLMAKKGVTTNELDQAAQQLHHEAHAIAAPLGYGSPPFPKSICTSLNEVICHGIPDNTILKEGDILNIDVTSIVDGFYGDCSRMVIIGKTTDEKKRLVNVTYDCLMKSIEICAPCTPIKLIGETIEIIAKENHFSVVNQFVGHGVGVSFHEPPNIPHHYNNMTIPLIPGMIFTIEPMINVGVREAVIDPKDLWTARTKDLKPSAQWEHTILITETGHEILTLV